MSTYKDVEECHCSSVLKRLLKKNKSIVCSEEEWPLLYSPPPFYEGGKSQEGWDNILAAGLVSAIDSDTFLLELPDKNP